MIDVIHKMERKARKMLSLGIFLLFVSGLHAEMFISHAPSHVHFLKDAADLKLSEIPDVISTSFGLQIDKDISWNGLGPGDLFRRPKANVLVTIETSDDKLKLAHVAHYNTEQDVPEVDLDPVAFDLMNLAGEGEKPLIVDMSQSDRVLEIRSHHPELFRDVPATTEKLRHLLTDDRAMFDVSQIGSLNVSNDADLGFLGELRLIQAIVNAVREKGAGIQGSLPNFFHFKIRGFERLAASHGVNSQAVKDAHTLLNNFIIKITGVLCEAYQDNVVVEVVTVAPHGETRKARHLMQAAAPTASPINAELGLAAEYDAMFPVAFNIILWLMVVMALAVIGISYGIWFMDPGRDSIIYRMTSQRIKKD